MKIFYLVSRLPYPIDKGDKLRAYNQIKILHKNHEIYLFALDEDSGVKTYSNELLNVTKKIYVQKLSKPQIFKNLFTAPFSDIPFQVSYFYAENIKVKIENIINEVQPDIIFCQLIRMAEYVRDINNIPKVLDYVDVISEGLKRRIKGSNIFMKLILKDEYIRVKKYEELLYSFFNEKVIITEQDRDSLPFAEKDKVRVLPNGINTDYFKPGDKPKEYDILFTGNLSYPPNVMAVEYLINKILPIIQKDIGPVKVLIVGASPSRKILSLSSENITIKGWVDDIREYYAKARVFVAPMLIGTGLQNKLLEAMSMQIPSVTSSLSQCGIKALPGENILVAETPEEYSDHIINLLNNTSFADRIGKNARKFVLANYDWRIIESKIIALIDSFSKNYLDLRV